MGIVTKWLFLILLLPSPFASAASFGSCARSLGASKANSNLASESLNDVIREQIAALDLSIPVQTQSTLFTRWRARKLLSQMTESNFRNENFRNHWVEKVVSLKIDENLDLLSQIKSPMSEPQRLSLTSLVLRSLLHRGISATDKRGDTPRWRAIIRQIRHHPVFRLVFLWELPRRTITLTDTQVLALIQNGAPALEADPSFRNEVNRDRSEMLKRKVNSLAAAVFAVALTAYSGWAMYPEIEVSYNKGHELAVQENTRAFVDQVNGMSQINSDSITLKMAESELQILTENFVKRFGEKPTKEESLELRTKVCKVRYGDILSAGAQIQCMAF